MKKYMLIICLFVAAINAGAQTKPTVADSLKLENAKKQLSTFFTILNDVRLDSLFHDAPKTFLAPDDQAFAKLPPGMLDSLLKPWDKNTFDNQATLSWLLMDHIIPGKLSSKDVVKLIHDNNGQAVFTTSAGIKLTAKINSNRNIVFTDERGNEYIVKQFDIVDGNAIIFIISSVILPDKTKPIKVMLR